MADARRQRIITALDTLWKTILTAGGNYETDLGLYVFQWRTEDWQISEMTGLDMRDTNDDPIIVRGGNHIHNLSVDLEIKTYGVNAPTENRKAMADIETAIATDLAIGNGFLGGLAQNIKPVSNEAFEFEKKDKLIGSSVMNMEIQFITKAFRPYT